MHFTTYDQDLHISQARAYLIRARNRQKAITTKGDATYDSLNAVEAAFSAAKAAARNAVSEDGSTGPEAEAEAEIGFDEFAAAGDKTRAAIGELGAASKVVDDARAQLNALVAVRDSRRGRRGECVGSGSGSGSRSQ